MVEIYNTLHEFVSSIFGEGMSLKVWQYIYGVDVITTRADLIDYTSEVLSLFMLVLVLVFVVAVFNAIFKLLIEAIKWR